MNIKKRKERSKKKRLAASQMDVDDDEEKTDDLSTARQKSFEEVMLESDESDLGSDNDDGEIASKGNSTARPRKVPL